MARERTASSVQASRESSARLKAWKRAKLHILKEERQCKDCPEWIRWPPVSLHFDHLGDEPKYSNVGDLMSRSWAFIETEIAKCEVVCANHHAIRTHRRRLAEAVTHADPEPETGRGLPGGSSPTGDPALPTPVLADEPVVRQ